MAEVIWVVLACVLRATTKNRSSTFWEEKCIPRKILATPMHNIRCKSPVYRSNIMKICSHSAIAVGRGVPPALPSPNTPLPKMAHRDSEQCNKTLSIRAIRR